LHSAHAVDTSDVETPLGVRIGDRICTVDGVEAAKFWVRTAYRINRHKEVDVNGWCSSRNDMVLLRLLLIYLQSACRRHSHRTEPSRVHNGERTAGEQRQDPLERDTYGRHAEIDDGKRSSDGDRIGIRCGVAWEG
jgi:hypothetical protein